MLQYFKDARFLADNPKLMITVSIHISKNIVNMQNTVFFVLLYMSRIVYTQACVNKHKDNKIKLVNNF